MIYVIYFEPSGKVWQQVYGHDLASFPLPEEGSYAMLMEAPVRLPGYVENSNYYELPPQPSDAHVFNYVTRQWEDLRTLDDFKAEKWGAVKAQRDAQEFGPFLWGSLTFDGDAESKSRLSLAAMAAQAEIASGQSWSVDWTLADNSTVTLSAPDVIGVVQAMGAAITAAHQAARLKRAAIEAAQTIEDLDAI